MNATELHLLARKWATEFYDDTSVYEHEAAYLVRHRLESLERSDDIDKWSNLQVHITRPDDGKDCVTLRFEVFPRRAKTSASIDVTVEEGRAAGKAVTVADFAKQLNDLVTYGKGDYYVVTPGVAGDHFLERVETDESDAPEWPVCVLHSEAESAREYVGRVRDAMGLPDSEDAEDVLSSISVMRDELDVVKDELQAADNEIDATDKALGEMRQLITGADEHPTDAEEALEMVRTLKRDFDKLEKCINLEPHQLTDLDIYANADFGSESAYCQGTLKVFLTLEDVEKLKKALKRDDLSVKKVEPKTLTLEPEASAYLQRLREALVVLRAKLMETWSAGLVDGILLAELREGMGEKLFQALVDSTPDVLSKTVKLPKKQGIANDDYVHLRPTGSEFGKTVKTILLCGAAISESAPPPTTRHPRQATCPHCVVAYEKKWRTYMNSTKP